MEDAHKPPGAVALLAEALVHPLRKWTWWLIVTVCGVGIFWMLNLMASADRGTGRLGFVVAVLAAVIVRAYFSAMENTITGYGEELGESGLRMDEFWESLGRVAGAAAMAWGPAVIAVIYLGSQEMALEPWTSLLGGLGCEYFPMALLGIVNFGGVHGATPQVVIPGIFHAGPFYMFAALGLLLVPYGAVWTYAAFADGGLVPSIVASSVASYFLVAHARLVGRIYLVNREHLGWE